MLNIFRLFWEIWVYFQAYKIHIPLQKLEAGEKLELENLKKVSVSEKKNRHRYRSWTLVSVPNTITWFWMYINPRLTHGLLFHGAVILDCMSGWLNFFYRRLGRQINKGVSIHFYTAFLADLCKRNYE